MKIHVVLWFICCLLSGRVFNGSTTYQNTGLDISNMTFLSFIVNDCTTVEIILSTNSSYILADYYRFTISMTAVAVLYVHCVLLYHSTQLHTYHPLSNSRVAYFVIYTFIRLTDSKKQNDRERKIQ